MELVNQAVARLRKAGDAERETIKAELIAALQAGTPGVRDALDSARKGEPLEVQWEIEEVLEKTAPPVAATAPEPAPPPPKEEPADPNRPLTAKDLVLVYDDPRGLLLHKAKVGDRWFATQVDPRTKQPQTFELHPQEVAQLKQSLAGSPYWVIGAEGAPAPAAKAPPAPPRGPGPR